MGAATSTGYKDYRGKERKKTLSGMSVRQWPSGQPWPVGEGKGPWASTSACCKGTGTQLHLKTCL